MVANKIYHFYLLLFHILNKQKKNDKICNFPKKEHKNSAKQSFLFKNNEWST